MNATDKIDAARIELMLGELRLPGIKLAWAALAATADNEGWPAARFLAALGEQEIAERNRRRFERHLEEARLLPGKTLDAFDFAAVPMISKAQVQALAAGDAWIEKGANLLPFRAARRGKSHLAAALGLALVEKGWRVLFAAPLAGLVEIADALAHLEPPPRRSILFLSVTAEEKGLLGSQYYAEHPLYPLTKTLAEINMDGLNMLGRTRDIEVIGLGQSTLDDVMAAAAAEQGKVVKPDAEPEKGFYYRSDHFNFAKQGVPALDPNSGVDFIGKPEGWGLEMRHKFTSQEYHKPSDKIKPYWDLSGTVEDLRLFGEVGYRVANGTDFPAWKTGSEFKAKREAMMK